MFVTDGCHRWVWCRFVRGPNLVERRVVEDHEDGRVLIGHHGGITKLLVIPRFFIVTYVPESVTPWRIFQEAVCFVSSYNSSIVGSVFSLLSISLQYFTLVSSFATEFQYCDLFSVFECFA